MRVGIWLQAIPKIKYSIFSSLYQETGEGCKYQLYSHDRYMISVFSSDSLVVLF